MKLKGFWHDIVLTGIAAAVAAIFIVITAFIEPKLALAECCGLVAVFGFALLRAFTAKNRYKNSFSVFQRSLTIQTLRFSLHFRFPLRYAEKTELSYGEARGFSMR